MPTIKPVHRAFALIAGVVAIPLAFGQYFYPSFFLLLIASLILNDVHRAGKINPYRIGADLKAISSNKWFLFFSFYLIWLVDCAFIK